MVKKRYKNVVDMMRDITGDRALSNELSDHLARRALVTELVALRAARGLSQQIVAEKIGCTQSRISKVESSCDGELSLDTLVRYADALGLKIEIAFFGKDATLVDRVKHHAFCIKRLTDRLAKLGNKDKDIANGVASFLKEATFNLVRLVKSSAKHLQLPPIEACAPFSIDVCGVEGQDDEEYRKQEPEAVCI